MTSFLVKYLNKQILSRKEKSLLETLHNAEEKLVLAFNSNSHLLERSHTDLLFLIENECMVEVRQSYNSASWIKFDDVKIDIFNNMSKIIRSFLHPIIYLTNWVKVTGKKRGRIVRSLLKLYQTISSVPYYTFYSDYKKFYSDVLSIDSVLFNVRESVKDFPKKYLPMSIKKCVSDQIVNIRRGKALEFMYSMNFSKKGCAALLPSQIISSVASSIKLLGSKSRRITFRQRMALSLAVDYVFGKNLRFDRTQDYAPPTKSATYEFKRTDAGGYAMLNNMLEQKLGSDPLMPIQGSDWTDEIEYKTNFEQIDERARFSLLAEANKVRLLTIQSAKLQASVINFQTSLLSAWKHCRFSTMDVSDDLGHISEQAWVVNKFQPYMKRGLQGDNVYYSADYSDATNKLEKECSDFVIDIILNKFGKKIGKVYADNIRRCMGSREMDTSKIVFPNYENRDAAFDIIEEIRNIFNDGLVRQTNGQLMGNPLSFPLLCIINLATIIDTYSFFGIDAVIKSKRRNAYKNLRTSVFQVLNSDDFCLLINGDDMFTSSFDVNTILRHRNVSQGYGLHVNEKSIISRRLAQINSVLFSNQKRVYYSNQSIFYNNNIKNVGSVTEENVAALALSFDWNPVLQKNFINTTVPKISKKDPRMWGVSRDLGGLGIKSVPVPEGRNFRFSLIRQLNHSKYFVRTICPSIKSFTRQIKSLSRERFVFESDFSIFIAKRMINLVHYFYDVSDVYGPIGPETCMYQEVLNELAVHLAKKFKYTFLGTTGILRRLNLLKDVSRGLLPTDKYQMFLASIEPGDIEFRQKNLALANLKDFSLDFEIPMSRDEVFEILSDFFPYLF